MSRFIIVIPRLDGGALIRDTENGALTVMLDYNPPATLATGDLMASGVHEFLNAAAELGARWDIVAGAYHAEAGETGSPLTQNINRIAAAWAKYESALRATANTEAAASVGLAPDEAKISHVEPTFGAPGIKIEKLESGELAARHLDKLNTPVNVSAFVPPTDAGIAEQPNAGDLQSPAVVVAAADMGNAALDAGAQGEQLASIGGGTVIERTVTVEGIDPPVTWGFPHLGDALAGVPSHVEPVIEPTGEKLPEVSLVIPLDVKCPKCGLNFKGPERVGMVCGVVQRFTMKGNPSTDCDGILVARDVEPTGETKTGVPIELPRVQSFEAQERVPNFQPYSIAADVGRGGWVIKEREHTVLVTARDGLRSGGKALVQKIAAMLNDAFAREPYRVEPVSCIYHTGQGEGRVCHEYTAHLLTGAGTDENALVFGEDGYKHLIDVAAQINDAVARGGAIDVKTAAQFPVIAFKANIRKNPDAK